MSRHCDDPNCAAYWRDQIDQITAEHNPELWAKLEAAAKGALDLSERIEVATARTALAASQEMVARLRGALAAVQIEIQGHDCRGAATIRGIVDAALATPTPSPGGEPGQGAQRDGDGIRALIEAAREVKRVRDSQVAYTRQLQQLASEARATGKSQSHRIPTAPRVHDYGDCIAALLEALEKCERKGTSTVPAPPAPKPAPIPTGMEPGYEISWDGERWETWPLDRMPGPAECRYVRKKG